MAWQPQTSTHQNPSLLPALGSLKGCCASDDQNSWRATQRRGCVVFCDILYLVLPSASNINANILNILCLLLITRQFIHSLARQTRLSFFRNWEGNKREEIGLVGWTADFTPRPQQQDTSRIQAGATSFHCIFTTGPNWTGLETVDPIPIVELTRSSHGTSQDPVNLWTISISIFNSHYYLYYYSINCTTTARTQAVLTAHYLPLRIILTVIDYLGNCTCRLAFAVALGSF